MLIPNTAAESAVTPEDKVEVIQNIITPEKEEPPAFPQGNPEPKEVKPPVIKIAYKQSEVIDYARQKNKEIFGEQHWDALYLLWESESGWNPEAVNKTSGACGVPQFLPCRDHLMGDYKGQIDAGLIYIRDSVQGYKNPTVAYREKLRKGWY